MTNRRDRGERQGRRNGRSRRATSALAAGLLALATAACSSAESSHDADHGSTAPTGACASDGRKDVFTAGLTKTAAGISARILTATPAPPAKGTNTMTVEILDAAGAPIDGAALTVTPFMPDHGHGSAVKPEVAAEGGGRYRVDKLYLSMAGLWTLTVKVERPQAAPAEIAFAFCIEG